MINLLKTSLTAAQTGGDYQADFEASSPIDWSQTRVEWNVSWITAYCSKVNNKYGTITVHLDLTAKERSGVVTLYCYDEDDKTQQYDLTVIQEGPADVTFDITPKQMNVDKEASTATIIFTKDRVESVTGVADVAGVVTNIKETYAEIDIPENPTDNDRIIHVKFTAEGHGVTIEKTATIIQYGDASFDVDSENITVDYNAINFIINAYPHNVDNIVESDTVSDFAEVRLITSPGLAQLHIDVSHNDTNYTRHGEIRLSGITASGSQASVTIYLTQTGNPDYLEFPIWKDTSITFTAPTYYRILDSKDKVIYNGHSYANEIYINRIIKSYIESNIQLTDIPFGGLLEESGAYVTFRMQIKSKPDDEFVDYRIIRSYYDYSYEDRASFHLSKPISKIIDPRQIFVYSVFNSFKGPEQTFTYHNTGTGGVTRFYDLEKGSYNYVNDQPKEGNIFISYNGEEERFTVKDTCRRYCLYYLNTQGGWDSLLFDGKCIQSAENQIFTFTADIDNSQLVHSDRQYLKQKRDKWSLTTGYLTDRQAELMPLLLDSTKAYLHDLADNKIIPVTINNTSYQIKTYRNQGRKLFTYTIEVSNSLLKTIR